MVMRLVFVNMPMFARYAMQRTPLIHEEYNGLWRLSSGCRYPSMVHHMQYLGVRGPQR